MINPISGKIEKMRQKRAVNLRRELLGIDGIGPETADSILLYAVKKPVFVIDAYTRRITACLELTAPDEGYDGIKALFEDNLPKSRQLFNEYHALLVEHAKRVCKSQPACQECILHSLKKDKR